MTSRLTSLIMSTETETTEATTELPFEPIWFGVLALAVFVVLLLVTFAFRSVHTRH